jgi:hypothetical protein
MILCWDFPSIPAKGSTLTLSPPLSAHGFPALHGEAQRFEGFFSEPEGGDSFWFEERFCRFHMLLLTAAAHVDRLFREAAR